MGREWLYKAIGGGRYGAKSPSTAAGKTVNTKKANYKNTSSSGCMSAIYNLFDIPHHHQLRFHNPPFVPAESAILDDIHHTSFSLLQGIEAPRNSLESSESAMKVAHTSSKANAQTNLNIPVGRIKIKANRSSFSDDFSPETCISPGTKTPNLVARLMGLDILPEYSSPRPSASSVKANSDHLSRSLPASPRLSTASRKSADNVFHHHRPSLQMDNENYHNCKEKNAKEITKQMRERISRRLGTDITNTVSLARSKYQRRDLNLVKALVIKTAGKPIQIPILFHYVKRTRGNLNKPVLNARPTTIEEVKSKPVMKLKVVKDEKIKKRVSERYDLSLKEDASTREGVCDQQQVNYKKFDFFQKRDDVILLNNTKVITEAAGVLT